MAETMAARSSRPSERSAATAISWVVPAGILEEIAPSNTTLVACPSTLGAATDRATADTEATAITTRAARKGASRPSILRKEGQKAVALPGGGPADQSSEEA